MTNQEKSKNAVQKNAYKQQENEKFIAGLPMSVKDFQDLFDDLDAQLSETECDDTLAYTEEFLRKQQLPEQAVINWLKENGAYCDCEVLGNVEEKFETF